MLAPRVFLLMGDQHFRDCVPLPHQCCELVLLVEAVLHRNSTLLVLSIAVVLFPFPARDPLTKMLVP